MEDSRVGGSGVVSSGMEGGMLVDEGGKVGVDRATSVGAAGGVELAEVGSVSGITVKTSVGMFKSVCARDGGEGGAGVSVASDGIGVEGGSVGAGVRLGV
jgi:hypothetical protein